MGHVSDLALWAASALLTIYLSRIVFQHRAYKRALRLHGCLRPARYRHKDPILGLDLFMGTIRGISDGNSFDYFHDLFAKYGKTFEANSWGKPALYTMDPDNIHTILVLSQKKFVVEPARLLPTEIFLGRGIFNTDGAPWEHARALIRPIFARAQISNLDRLKCRVDDMLALIPHDQSTVDLLPLLKRLFLDTSTELIFGESVNTLVPSTSGFKAEKLLLAFDTALRGIGIRVALGRFAFLQGLDRSWRRACDEVHTFVDQNIDKAIKNRSSRLEDPSRQKYLLLDDLLQETQDRTYLRSQLLNIFLPARDSTAIAVSNVLFLVARNSYVWGKLRTEVFSNDAPLTFETLKSMNYVKCVVNEGLRLIAPSGRNIRIAGGDCILPKGGGPDGSAPIFVPKGTEVNFVFRSMQWDKDIWGEDAEEFKPERWENLDSIPSWAYVPFSSGGRVCPAKQLVLNECAYILVRLVQEFEEIQNRDPEERFIEQHKLQMESRNGVKVAFVAGL